MKNIDEKLSEVLGIEPLETKTKELQVYEEPTSNEVEDDFEFARNNLKQLIKKGASAIEGILFVAKESEHPRAYEVASNFLKNLSEINKDLLELQKTKKDVQKNSRQLNDPGINVQKAVFVGSTAELSKLLKAKKEETDG